jgi:hypothetical protein
VRPVRLDASARSVVAWCASCPPWREVGSRPLALRAAAVHLELVHGNARKAAQLREQARRIERRHAD